MRTVPRDFTDHNLTPVFPCSVRIVRKQRRSRRRRRVSVRRGTIHGRRVSEVPFAGGGLEQVKGTLQAVLTHYEEECTFHAVTCQRCSGTVLQQDLPRHYRADCHGSVIGSATGDATILQGAVLGTDDIGSSIDAFKALLSNFYEDRLPAIQSTINELLETARSTDSAIGAIRVSCEESEQRITQATRQLSATFATQLQSQQCALSASLKENFPINEISQEVMNHGRRIDEMTKALSDSKRSLSDQIAQATRELSATLGRELQYQQATMASDLKKHLDMNETSEQVKSQCMRIDAIAKKLHDLELRSSHQLAEAVEELSKTFAKKLESQRRQLCTHLKQMSELETSSPAAAGTTSTSEMPWRLEKRHILRKLELVATDSHAYLELLRTIADQKLQRPVVEYRPVLPDSLAGTKIMPPLMGNGENEEGYTVSITNVYDVVKSEQFIFLLNRWYRRDRYLQVATYGWSCYVEQTLTVCVKWGTTTQGLCSASQEARVWVKHPDYPKKENLHASLENVGAPQDKVVDALATMSRKVTGLNATPLGATSVRVEWRAPAEDAIGYNVRAVSLNAHNLEINTSDTSIVVHGLVPESQYVLSVSPFIVESGIVIAGAPANSTVTTGVVRK
ncbi:hypothetical protein HPB48_012277 [Haemaphysalis longicornis]|uniref:Fibronectin type-III domain-containing protein n=1 Tax=Haemaphysalis longicornis TaxID=44386 RepID=A0A9J6FL34_HAELO|nr:hypothetical protein HPB48_012277 [Haemaphysalis longicornis]